MSCVGIFLTGPKKGEQYESGTNFTQVLRPLENAGKFPKGEIVLYSYLEWAAGDKIFGFWIDHNERMSVENLDEYIMTILIEALKQ